MVLEFKLSAASANVIPETRTPSQIPCTTTYVLESHTEIYSSVSFLRQAVPRFFFKSSSLRLSTLQNICIHNL